MTGQIDTEAIRQSVDLRDIAETYTTLRYASTGEMEGSCPLCGGDDRFHCTDSWFFCRQCHGKRGDAIEFIQWVAGLGFLEACQALTHGELPTKDGARVRPKRKKRPPVRRFRLDRGKALALSKKAHDDLLFAPEAEEGRAYLLGRGLPAPVWGRFRLGFRPFVTFPRRREGAPAILIPWVVGGEVVSLQHRYILTSGRVLPDGVGKTKRLGGVRGSLYGGHALTGPAPGRTLVLVEGELNAASIWWGTQGQVDALSYGSESSIIYPRLAESLRQWSRIVVWADRLEVAERLAAEVGTGIPITPDREVDANDLLVSGQLADFLGGIGVP